MTDREPLELAARAAGFGKSHYENGSWLDVRYGLTEAIWSDHHEGYWNPLEDDGDALRLVVTLGLELNRVAGMNKTMCWYGRHGVIAQADSDCGNDPNVATRRAIVRAAAEVGMKMDAQPVLAG